ncbi:MAG TPA: type IV toxin-antitoxin system AbiEi family antitoxin domain-containing protein [Clostridia bacterium]
MSFYDKLNEIIIKNNGIIFSFQADEAQISRVYLSKMVGKGMLEKVSRGVYLSPDTFDDEMFRLQVRYSRGIFSHGTALFLHDLTDRTPINYTMTFPVGYNTPSLKDENIIAFFIKRELCSLGVCEMKTSLNRDIKVYDVERTICDIVRSRNQLDVQIVNEAIRRYINRKDKNIPKLLEFAAAFRVRKIVSHYVEVLL